MILDNIQSLIEENKKEKHFHINPSHALLGAGAVLTASQLAKYGILGKDMQDAYNDTSSYMSSGMLGAKTGWQLAQNAYDTAHFQHDDGNYLDRMSQSTKGLINGFKIGSQAQYYVDKLPPGTKEAVSMAYNLIPIPKPKLFNSSE